MSVTIESIAATLADERRELRAALAPLADLPAVLRELARVVTAAPVPPEQELRHEGLPEGLPEFMRAHRERAASAVLLELSDDLGLDRHRRLLDGSKVEDLPAVELRREIVKMLRVSANTDVAQESLLTCRLLLDVSDDAGWMERTVIACKDAVAASWEQKERAERAEGDLRALFRDLGCERASIDDLAAPELRPALVEALRARAAETVAHTCDAEHALVRARTALRGGLERLGRPWAADDDVESLVTQLLLACSLARAVDYVPIARSFGLSVTLDGLDGPDARAALVQAIRDRALVDRQADVVLGQDSVVDAVAAALSVPGRAEGETAADWAARIAAQIGERETLTMERDDALAQLRATDAVLRRAVPDEGMTTCELAQRLAAIRERTLEEADASSGAAAIAAARDTLVKLEQTLRAALQTAGESTDNATVLEIAERLAARATDLPRSARDGARREQRAFIAALALDVCIDHLSVPGARTKIIHAMQNTTDAANNRAAEQLRDVCRVLRIVTPGVPEHVSVLELAHDVAEHARRATDGMPDYKRPIDEVRRTDDGAVWAVWSACQTLGVEIAEDMTIREACDAMGARLDSLAVWVRDSLPLVRLWDRQLMDLCPLDVPALDKARSNAACLGATDDADDVWKDLARDARAVADGDDIDGLVSWIAEDKDIRAVLGALLDRVEHLESELEDDVDPRTETPLAEKLAQRLFERLPFGVPVETIQELLHLVGEDASPDDPAVHVLLAAVSEAQQPRDLVAWCALTPSVRNRLIDRTQDALDAVAS